MIRGISPADLITGMADEDVAELAVEAYLYGFPLVFNLDQVLRYVTTGVGSNPKAPFNQFSHARTLAGPQDTFVTINNDTLYSMAQLDLSVGPVRLHVPDTDWPVLRAAIRGRLDQQLRLRRAPGHRHRRG